MLVASIAALRFAQPPSVDKPTQQEIDNHVKLSPKPGTVRPHVPHSNATPNPGMLMPPRVLINRYLPDAVSEAYIKAARDATAIAAAQPGKPITNDQLDGVVVKSLTDSYRDSLSDFDFQRVFVANGTWGYVRWSTEVPDLAAALRKTAQDAYTKAAGSAAPAH